MGNVGHDADRAPLLEGLRRDAQRPGRIHHVVHEDADLALHLTDHVHDLGHVRPWAAFVDDGEIGVVEALRQGACADHAAHVRGNHDDVVIFLLPGIPEQDRRCVDIVHGDIEESLYLVGVQVHRQNPVHAGLADQLCHQFGRDRHPVCARPAILPGVTEVRYERGHPGRRGPLHGVGHDQQLHQVLVHRRAGRLHQVNLTPPNVLHDFDHDFAVAEAADIHSAQGHVKMMANVLGKRGMRVTRKYGHCSGIQSDLLINRHRLSFWLGWQDSNLRFTGSKPVALPLGYTPLSRIVMRPGG